MSEREDRFEAARGILVASLERGRRLDGWFHAPGVVGRHFGRDCTITWPGGASATRVLLATRIRCGDTWSAKGRNRFLQWLGFQYLALRGEETPDAFQLERLLRDFDVARLWGGEGLIHASARWDPDQPEPARLLKILERLHRIALDLEGVRVPKEEDGGELFCPFCRTAIGEAQAIARCESCWTPHHPACFDENHGCALYGCDNRSARTRSGRVSRKQITIEGEAATADANRTDEA